MDRLEQEWNGRVLVVRLNMGDEDTQLLATRLGFRLTPTFILLDGDGRERWRSVGTLNANAVNEEVNALH